MNSFPEYYLGLRSKSDAMETNLLPLKYRSLPWKVGDKNIHQIFICLSFYFLSCSYWHKIAQCFWCWHFTSASLSLEPFKFLSVSAKMSQITPYTAESPWPTFAKISLVLDFDRFWQCISGSVSPGHFRLQSVDSPSWSRSCWAC